MISLETSQHAALVAMRPELATLVEAGVEAAANRDTLALRYRDFRNVGERARLFSEVNAERKELHGALSKLALSTPGLPSTFANEFFKPGESSGEPEDTIESVSAEILALEEALAQRRERLTELEQDAADAAQEAEDTARKAARLAELKQEIEARQREAQALADELD